MEGLKDHLSKKSAGSVTGSYSPMVVRKIYFLMLFWKFKFFRLFSCRSFLKSVHTQMNKHDPNIRGVANGRAGKSGRREKNQEGKERGKERKRGKKEGEKREKGRKREEKGERKGKKKERREKRKGKGREGEKERRGKRGEYKHCLKTHHLIYSVYQTLFTRLYLKLKITKKKKKEKKNQKLLCTYLVDRDFVF